MSKPVFLDERQRRWWFTRRTMEVGGLLAGAVAIVFLVQAASDPNLPQLDLRETHPEIHSLRQVPRPTRPVLKRPEQKKRIAELGKIPANYDPLRAGFYVSWDFTSLSSLQRHYRDLDLLIPELLHGVRSDGHMTQTEDANLSRWLETIKAGGTDIEMMPLINNYDGVNWRIEEMAAYLAHPETRKRLVDDIMLYLTKGMPLSNGMSVNQSGIVVDFEEVPEKSQEQFRDFVRELTIAAHRLNKKVMVCLPAADWSYDYKFFGQNSDAIILMNYDQHWLTSKPGPITGQDWYMTNLRNTLKEVPPEKLVMGIANYSYDWPEKITAKTKPVSTSYQQALVTARESETEVEFDSESLNPFFTYEEDKITHHVWLLDALTAYNEIRAAERLQVRGTALWRLGSEDPSIWSIWDATRPDDAARNKVTEVPPGYDLVLEGAGDIWHIADTPQAGRRTFHYDSTTDTFNDEHYVKLPLPYRIEQIGAPDRQIALTFDDGPDRRYTPRILDILKQKHVTATFFVVGLAANEFPDVLDRIYAEGNEIGNHTYTHPRFDEIPRTQLRMELSLTELLLESRLGIKTLLFRPPYGIDHQPESENDVRLLPVPQAMGYVLVGSKIDSHDWGSLGGGAPPPPAKIIQNVLDQAEDDNLDGHIVLMHDGGGLRENTVRALPGIIDGLRQNGYQLTTVSALMGKTRAQTMPVLDRAERWTARADGVVFDTYHWLRLGFSWIFIIGIALISARALLIGLLALIEKLRPQPGAHPEYKPVVSVLIPAYNEEESIVRTVDSALASDYPNLQVIVVDDGSKDRTGELLEQHFGGNERVRIIHQANQGKPAALNHALAQSDGELVVTIDADTAVNTDAVTKLVRNFADSTVGAVAGNTKVGNRHLWLTRWQALEYISSQNMEKRAFDLLNCITVVPGAIGAWRTDLLRQCGGFSHDTVAEDTDLTLAIRRRNWRILYDDEAIAYTQAPETARELIAQRFRWTFGTMQAVWKHRDTLGRPRYGTLGFIAIPNVFLFQILLPLFSPIIDLLFLGSLLLWGLAQFRIAQIPVLWTAQDVELSMVFFLAFMVVDFFTCMIAFALERHEDWTLLLPIVLQRFYYRQMMYVVLHRAVMRAVQGRAVGWGHPVPATSRRIAPPDSAAPGKA